MACKHGRWMCPDCWYEWMETHEKKVVTGWAPMIGCPLQPNQKKENESMNEQTVEVKVQLPRIEGYEDTGFRNPKKDEIIRVSSDLAKTMRVSYDYTIPRFCLRKVKPWRAEKGEHYLAVRARGENTFKACKYTEYFDPIDNTLHESGNYFNPDSPEDVTKAEAIADELNQKLTELLKKRKTP